MKVVELRESHAHCGIAFPLQTHVQLRAQPGEHLVQIVAVDDYGLAARDHPSGFNDAAVRACGEIPEECNAERRCDIGPRIYRLRLDAQADLDSMGAGSVGHGGLQRALGAARPQGGERAAGSRLAPGPG